MYCLYRRQYHQLLDLYIVGVTAISCFNTPSIGGNRGRDRELISSFKFVHILCAPLLQVELDTVRYKNVV